MGSSLYHVEQHARAMETANDAYGLPAFSDQDRLAAFGNAVLITAMTRSPSRLSRCYTALTQIAENDSVTSLTLT